MTEPRCDDCTAFLWDEEIYSTRFNWWGDCEITGEAVHGGDKACKKFQAKEEEECHGN